MVATVAVLVVGAVGAVVLQRATAPKPAEPTAAPLQFTQADLVFTTPQSLARWLPVSGTLEPVHLAVVKSKVSGDVREITVREGDKVQAGQVVARFDKADLDAKVAERVGALESARAQLALAEKTRAMNNKLLSAKFISQNAYDSSESGLSVAQGSLKSAEAQVKLAQISLRDAVVVAPLSGTVAKRHVQPGEKVAFDAPLITIVDLTDLEMQALVPASDVPELRVGMPVELRVDGFGERAFPGKIDRINPSTEAGTRAIMVYVTLRNPETTLRGGMYANGRVALSASTPVATLPANAVRTEAGQTYVWVIEGGKLAKRLVTVGRRDDTAGIVELKTVLPAGVPVLAARFENLKEGAPVLVKAAQVLDRTRQG